MSLQDLQRRWLEKWDEMHELSSSKVAIAAPFMSVGVYPLDSRLPKAATIMIVGKATHGDWCMGPFEEARAHPESERIQEVCSKSIS